jgi:hypothetical protein
VNNKLPILGRIKQNIPRNLYEAIQPDKTDDTTIELLYSSKQLDRIKQINNIIIHNLFSKILLFNDLKLFKKNKYLKR